ncbi:MAG: lipopolysaccharide assembly protein LapA domain-containing protein [Acidobacteria bacterium]|nr:lipopolysaccharide assembly protein LapA domain-containing protein [Acidobacteriota bacterium]
MSLLILMLCLIFFGGLLFLVTQNGSPVDVVVLFASYRQVPLSVVMTLSLLAGIGFTALISFLDGARLRLQNRRLRRQVGRLEVEIQQLNRAGTKTEAAKVSTVSPPRDYSST